LLQKINSQLIAAKIEQVQEVVTEHESESFDNEWVIEMSLAPMIFMLSSLLRDDLELLIHYNGYDNLYDCRYQAPVCLWVKQCALSTELWEELHLEQSVVAFWVDNTCEVQETDVLENDKSEMRCTDKPRFEVPGESFTVGEKGLLLVCDRVDTCSTLEIWSQVIHLLSRCVIVPLNEKASLATPPEDDEKSRPEYDQDWIEGIKGWVLQVPHVGVDYRENKGDNTWDCEPLDKEVHPWKIYGDLISIVVSDQFCGYEPAL